jgi:NAD(P)H dehydrogenase (quinone)
MLLISTARVGTRVGQHRNAIEAAVRAGVKHIVYTSTLGANNPDHPAMVKIDHRATEEIIERSGAAWTFLRDSQYAEALTDAIAPAAIMNGSLHGMSGEGKVAFVSRSDCVACAVAVLTTPGHENKAYDLTGPELWTFPRAIKRVSEIVGKEIPYVLVDEEGMYAYFDAMGAPRHASDIVPDGPIPWSSDDMVTYEKALRDGYFDVINDNVKKLTGHKPRGLEEVLQAAKAKWPPVTK